MTFLKRVTDWFTYIACIAAILMMVQTSLDVAGRYLFNAPLTGTIEMVGLYCMIAIVFLPLAFVERYDRHIHAEVLVNFFPKLLRRVVLGLAFVASATFFTIIGYQSLLLALRSFQTGEIAFGANGLVLWPSRFLLPIGFFSIALMSVARLVRETILGHPVEDPPEGLGFNEEETS